MNSISKRLWDLQRFGLDPCTAANRISGRLLPYPVLVVSIPKAGTHLVERAICLWTECYRAPKPTLRKKNNWGGSGLAQTITRAKPGQVFFAHARWSEEVQRSVELTKTKVIFVIRHPLDILLSFSHHVISLKSHWLHESFKEIESVEERIALALEGDSSKGIPAFSEKLKQNLPWMENSNQVVRFEELIGEKGGGDYDTQRQAVFALWDTLELGCESDDERQRILELIFSSASPTFRSGKIGKGVDLAESLKQDFARKNSALVRAYGYD